MKYIPKEIYLVEAVTFDELIQHGRDNGGNIVNGMPWSFEWQGFPVTHEADNWYIVDSGFSVHPGDMLICDCDGAIQVMPESDFRACFDPAPKE